MPVFDELMSSKKVEDPEPREVQDIKKSDEIHKAGRFKSSTSVTIGRYKWTMRIVVFILTLIVIAILGYLIYLGVTSFIPESS